MDKQYRGLPSVDRVLSDDSLTGYGVTYPHDLLVSVIREQLEQERLAIKAGRPGASLDEIVRAVAARLETMVKPSLRRIINASGGILHTNLGRAPIRPG